MLVAEEFFCVGSECVVVRGQTPSPSVAVRSLTQSGERPLDRQDCGRFVNATIRVITDIDEGEFLFLFSM